MPGSRPCLPQHVVGDVEANRAQRRPLRQHPLQVDPVSAAHVEDRAARVGQDGGDQTGQVQRRDLVAVEVLSDDKAGPVMVVACIPAGVNAGGLVANAVAVGIGTWLLCCAVKPR